jgi:hypothetical protein
MQREVVVAGNGVGLKMVGQQSDIPSFGEGVDGGVVYKSGLIRNNVAKCTWVVHQKFLGSRLEASMIY